MASVTNTYARAFVDAVFDVHLDPEKTLQEVQAVAALVAESKDLRGLGSAVNHGGAETRRAGCNCCPPRNLADREEFHRGTNRSSTHKLSGTNRETI